MAQPHLPLVFDAPPLAEFDSTARYRYTLRRRWGAGNRTALFIALNPSTADETQDDPTIRREIQFARDWGFDGLTKCNLFALRSTDPDGMLEVDDPVGADNDAHILREALKASIIVAAWGAYPLAKPRAERVLAMLSQRIYCLGLTKDGAPRHPLYLPQQTALEIYREARS